jgi:hypothetical protein
MMQSLVRALDYAYLLLATARALRDQRTAGRGGFKAEVGQETVGDSHQIGAAVYTLVVWLVVAADLSVMWSPSD